MIGLLEILYDTVWSVVRYV